MHRAGEIPRPRPTPGPDRPRLRFAAPTALLLGLAACTVSAPPAEGPVVRARFDPEAGVVPTPADLLRDAEAGRLALPAEPDDLEGKTAAEVALVRALNRRDGWPIHTEARLAFSGTLDPASIRPSAVRVFESTREGLRRLEVPPPAGRPEAAPTELVLPVPEGGWPRGRRLVVAVLGGEAGLRGSAGEPVVGDAAFWFLRAEGSLLDHVDALPGATRAERLEAAERLEPIRLELAPYFDQLAAAGVPRGRVAALWAFTTSEATEVVFDPATGDVPLPSDLLRDPVTGRVDLPDRAEDTEYTRVAKRALRRLDGFALSAGLSFGTTAPVDLASLTSTTVEVWALSDGEVRPVPIDVALREGGTRVSLRPRRPLAAATEHLVVVRAGARDDRGRPLAAMSLGMLLGLDAPLFVDGASQLGSLDAERAARLEPVRAANRRALDAVTRVAPDRGEVVAAWPFRTMSVVPAMLEARDAAARAALSPDPVEVERVPPIEAAFDFLAGALTMLRVADVYEGYITVPDHLDPITRARRDDGGWAPKRVRFTMTIPRGADRDRPLPVAIFGHGLMADRRFVLSVADTLASEGMAGIAIDFPFHGERAYCAWSGPQCLINPFNLESDPICPPPCRRGTMCAEDGRCVDNAGDGNALAEWPLVNFPTASGGAYVDVHDLAGTRDHFFQSITEVAALHRALREGAWRDAIGYELDPDVRYVGQSLGGIVGAVFTAVTPSLRRVVLNVPGADLVDLFRTSTIFAPHIDAFLVEQEVEPGSAEHERFLDVARWIMDAVDPQSFAQYILQERVEGGATPPERTVLVQLATLDAVIPNPKTELLVELGALPLERYIAEHAFLVVPIEPAFLRGTRDVARVLGRGMLP